jgi:hypothetical protein
MAEAQDGGLIRQPGELGQLCKFPLQRYIEEGIFRGWIRQGEPQLQEVCAQHGLQGKGWSAILAFRVVGRNECDQFSPRHHPLHLL